MCAWKVEREWEFFAILLLALLYKKKHFKYRYYTVFQNDKYCFSCHGRTFMTM